MLPEDIDDLFRDKLDGHATPPHDALWARLQAEPSAAPEPGSDRLDQLFRQRLNSHATAPGREVWERLEDEHLRPRKRRPAAWWPMALAAVVALLLVAGGVGLWSGRSIGSGPGGAVASQQTRTAAPAVSAPAASSKQPIEAELARAATATQSAGSSALTTAAAPETMGALATQKNTLPQATRSSELASTAPKANRATAGQSPRHYLGTNRQPDAATDHRPQVARTTPRPAPAPARSTVADEPRPTPEPSTIALAPKPAPTPEIVRTLPVPTASLASTSELITVDVRNGGTPPARLAKISSSALAAAEAPAGRRGLGGRLLQQAGHLARGERVSLAEITGLPENVTLQANLAGRSISKSIRL
ncbi:hypothetical protein [Hymenobacter antarcticus]|uniref:Uncharacterized protein n=1 Tax=Hymenobacter antarcticus TaxID=486270 RepID=A0ABP7PAN7_9BACT